MPLMNGTRVSAVTASTNNCGSAAAPLAVTLQCRAVLPDPVLENAPNAYLHPS